MKIIELPREAFQTATRIVPSKAKIRYLNALLKVGFDTVELGSMVSPRVIPQMADTLEVIKGLDLKENQSKLMMLVVNKKGAEAISEFDEIGYLSFPYSISPTFLKLNLNTTSEAALKTIDELMNISIKKNKILVLYISHAFGNPYDDPYHEDMLMENISMLQEKGVTVMPLSNISMEVGEAEISDLFGTVIPEFPDIEFGLHLHSSPVGCFEKIYAAWIQGCRRFDGVMNGLGGCPMTGKALLPNLNTNFLVDFLGEIQLDHSLDMNAFNIANKLAFQTFS